MSIFVVVWVVLMIVWLFGGCYWTWNPTQPAVLGNTIIPWLCVLIIGLATFGAFAPGVIH
jgi:hypothetical protein